MIGFLVITSLLSGNLMFSVTQTFSHCDLALVFKQKFERFFSPLVCEEFCCWETACIWLPVKEVWVSHWHVRCYCALTVILVWCALILWINPELMSTFRLTHIPAAVARDWFYPLWRVLSSFVCGLSKHFKMTWESPVPLSHSNHLF